MKVNAALMLALAGAAVAQNIPQCAQGCVNQYLRGGIGDCNIQDIGCICRNSAFLSNLSCCLIPSCDEAGLQEAVQAASEVCVIAGVTDIPTAVACSTGGGVTVSSASSSPAPSGSTPTPSGSGASTTPPPSSSASGGAGAGAASSSSSVSSNPGPRQTAAAGLGAIGGIIAAVAML